jgi:hypothetical protein
MAPAARRRALSVWSTSPGASAVAGRDLVLEVPLAHGTVLVRGAALDDHLDDASRGLADLRARERYERWRQQRAATLVVDFLDLASICELELLAQCFVPAARVEIGLPRAIEAAGAAAVTLRSIQPGMAGVLRAVAAREGVAVQETSDAPAGLTLRWRGSRLPVRAAAALGFPRRVRGRVVCVPYWNLTPVFDRLVDGDERSRPVASGIVLPGLDAGSTLRAALRGGWLGYAGARARRLAREKVAAALDGMAGGLEGDSLDAALDGWALSFLRDRAPAALVTARQARPAFAGGSVRALVVPFDTPPDMAGLVAEARRARIPSLLVQHGFDAELGVPDKIHVDVAALWSQRDRDLMPAGSGVRSLVTGNPGAEHLAEPDGRPGWRGRTLLLVDYHSRLSARVTDRVSQLHVATALEALAETRPDTTVVIRPHPASEGTEAYVPWPDTLAVEVDATTPIEELFGEVDACVGAMSTATLQAVGRGIPVVYLDVAGVDRPWPFDGTAVPVARNAKELADALGAALARRDVLGQAELLEALGARKGATVAVCELIAELARGGGRAS